MSRRTIDFFAVGSMNFISKQIIKSKKHITTDPPMINAKCVSIIPSPEYTSFDGFKIGLRNGTLAKGSSFFVCVALSGCANATLSAMSLTTLAVSTFTTSVLTVSANTTLSSVDSLFSSQLVLKKGIRKQMNTKK